MNRLLDLAPTNGNGHHRPATPPALPLAAPAPTMPTQALPVLIESHLYKLLGKLPPGWPAEPITIEATIYGTRALVRIGPAALVAWKDPDRPRLKARERRVLDTVVEECRRTGRRVIGKDVAAALRAAGVEIGTSTLNAILSDLVHGGHLVNDNDKAGYGPPDG